MTLPVTPSWSRIVAVTQAPRRLHADWNHPLADWIHVYVGGEKVRKVKFYDMDRGIVEYYMHDDSGKVMFHHGRPVTAFAYGKVVARIQ